MLATLVFAILALWLTPIALFALYALYSMLRQEAAEPLTPVQVPGQAPPGAP